MIDFTPKKEEVKNKIENISEITSNVISLNKSLFSKVNFSNLANKESSFAFFYGIIKYFYDTSELIHKDGSTENPMNPIWDNMFNSVAFLQAIYVQQDLIEELLLFFKCSTNKGDLKLDDNYHINRLIRNELVGHPIRRDDKKHFISSVIFSNATNIHTIEYFKYTKENINKTITHSKEEVLLRHYKFLNIYLDIIQKRIGKNIIKPFQKNTKAIFKALENAPFDNLVEFIDQSYDNFYKMDKFYSATSLKEVYAKKDNHERYSHTIEIFKNDLRRSLTETNSYIDNFGFTNPLSIAYDYDDEITVSRSYPINKLAVNKSYRDFEWFSQELRDMCPNDKIIKSELDNMTTNYNSPVEYYSSLNLIKKHLANLEKTN